MERNILLFAYCVVIGLYALYLFVEFDLSVMDSKYSDILNQKAAADREYTQLNDKLLRIESYHTIDQKARAMGFVSGEIIYLK